MGTWIPLGMGTPIMGWMGTWMVNVFNINFNFKLTAIDTSIKF
nr:hypothetical protein T28C6.2 - Caenorhabditis elegans [Caenorhabditis elegans]